MSIIIHQLEHTYGKGTAFEKVALYDINIKIEELGKLLESTYNNEL